MSGYLGRTSVMTEAGLPATPSTSGESIPLEQGFSPDRITRCPAISSVAWSHPQAAAT